MSRVTTVAIFLIGVLVAGREALGAPPANAHEMDLNGTWIASCHADSLGDYVEERVTFSKSRLFRRERWRFGEKDCLRETLADTRAIEGQFEITGVVKGTDTRQADFTVNKVFFTAYSGPSLKRFRDSELCQLSEWTPGERNEVTGLSCDGDSLPSGTVIRELLDREGSDRLYFATQSYFRDNRYLGNRPNRVDRNIVFVKAPVLAN